MFWIYLEITYSQHYHKTLIRYEFKCIVCLGGGGGVRPWNAKISHGKKCTCFMHNINKISFFSELDWALNIFLSVNVWSILLLYIYILVSDSLKYILQSYFIYTAYWISLMSWDFRISIMRNKVMCIFIN